MPAAAAIAIATVQSADMNVQKKVERPAVHKDMTELAHELNGSPKNPSAPQAVDPTSRDQTPLV